MPYSLMPLPKIRFFDADGAPLAGGKVYFYEPNSSTPKDTYTDRTGGTANQNPVVLDANGEAAIWLNGFYYVRWTDADDVQQGDADYVSSAPASDATTFSEWLATGLTPTYVSTTSFSVPGDETARFTAGRKVKAVVDAGTVYGVIKTSAYTSLTTVTLVMENSGALDSGLSSVSVGILDPAHPSFPALYALPRYTTTQRDALTAANGMVIYNTTANQVQEYQNGAWLVPATLTGAETLTNKTLTAPIMTTPKIATGGFIVDLNGDELLGVTATTTPITYLTLSSANTGAGPVIGADGETNVDINLTPKGSGQVKINGKFLGAWDTGKSVNTVYQAASDLMVFSQLYASGGGGNSAACDILSDASNPPTTSRARGYADDTYKTFPCLVRRGDYWKASASTSGDGSVVIQVIPIGA